MKFFRAGLLPCIIIFFTCAPSNQSSHVPVYIQDYHTGSFYWLARHLDWYKEYRLILFDAHSDAFAVYHSQTLKQDLRHAVEQGRLNELLEALRSHNIIQCYNWLEPLLPRPINSVIWVPPTYVDAEAEKRFRAQVKRELCARDPSCPAGACPLGNIFSIMDFEKLLSTNQTDTPCVVSIDLDYFACMTAERAEKKLEQVLDFVFRLPGLTAVTVAVSNIYLKDAAQGHLLLFFLLCSLVEKRSLTVFFEPFMDNGKDLSREAREFLQRGEVLPAYDIETAPDFLRRFFTRHRESIIVNHENRRWRELLDH